MGEALPCKEEPLSCARENERGKLKTGERQSAVCTSWREREREREKATEIEDVASKLSETRKVKPVSAV